MIEKSIKYLLNDSIKQLENKYNNNELAYLSLTGKNESFIRDNIAHHLFAKDNLWYKEFKRIDIARVVSSEKTYSITNIVELTSLYTSDILNENLF